MSTLYRCIAAYLLLSTGLAQAQQATTAQVAAPLQAQAKSKDATFTVSDIRIEGLQRISAGSVFNALPITVGTEIDQADLVNAAKVLFKTGNFDDMQLARDGDALVVQVQERPSISAINIEGNKAIETDALLEGLKDSGLAVGRVFKRSTLEGMQLELQRQYVSQGRYDAKIDSEIEEQPRNRVAVNINVNEGSVAKIKHINIVGNSVFDDDELTDLLELNTTGLLSFITGNDKYSKEKLSGDLETLESYYRDRGYVRFNLESTQVSITPDRDAVYITVNISEGEKYTISDVSLAGDIILPEEEIRRYLLLQPDDGFSQIRVTRTEEFITNRLGDEGYTFAEVKGVPEINDKDNSVAIKFFVDPGKRTYVRRIDYRGNTKTADEVLRREMRQMESAPASRQKIEQSRVRLERLGFFKEVEVETPEVAGSDDLVDVEYTVEEQPSGSIGASIGYAQDAGLILGANIQQNNFLGSGKRVGIGVNTSKYQDNYSLNYVNPYFTEDGVSRGFSLFYRSTDLDEVNISRFSTDTWGGNVSFGYPIKETQRLGLSLGYNRTKISTGEFAVQEIIGSPRLRDDVNQYIVTPYEQATRDDAGVIISPEVPAVTAAVTPNLLEPNIQDGFLDREGDEFNLFPLTASWTQSSLNRGQLATRGASQSFSAEFSLPGSDLEYYKLIYNGQYFVPLWRQFTLRFRGELGYGDGYGDTDGLPFFENFYSGGFGSVRGFKSNTLGPRSTPARTYLSLNQLGTIGGLIPTNSTPQSIADLAYQQLDPATGRLVVTDVIERRSQPFGGNISIETGIELLFPLPFVKDQRSLRSAFFIDAGNVFNAECGVTQTNCFDVDIDELRYSVGVGLTWITGFGPLTFSVAKPLNDSDTDRTEVFQFSLGQGF